MAKINVGCANESCTGSFLVDRSDTDQTLYCGQCSSVFTFVNLGVLTCEQCRATMRVALGAGLPQVRCGRCGHINRLALDGGPSPAVRICSLEQCLEQHQIIMYCPRDSFENLENEVNIARTVLQQVSRRGSWSPLKMMFINRLRPYPVTATIPGIRDLPFRHLRMYHAYCNFSMAVGAEPAKFSGTMAGFVGNSTINPFRLAVKECDCHDIWVTDESLKREFAEFPPMAGYIKYIQAYR